MEMTKFDIEFVERTKEIIETYQVNHNFSLLLNCTLGLIILPYERCDQPGHQQTNNLWDTNLIQIANIPDFKMHRWEPIKSFNYQTGAFTPSKKTFKVLLKKIRHGLAHQHIQPVNTGEIFTGVEIWNEFVYRDKRQPKKKEDVRVEFTELQLSQFALFIANLHLDRDKLRIKKSI